MKHILQLKVLPVLFVCLSLVSPRAFPQIADETTIIAGHTLPSLDAVARMPEEEIDLATVLFSIANSVHKKYFQQDLDIHRYMEQIDSLAVGLQQRLQGERQPQKIVEIMNRFFYEESGFKWDEVAEQDGRRMDNLLINSVLDRRSGTCAGLSYTYLAVGQRIGLPLKAVFIPEHAFVRFDNGKDRINIEAMDKGKGPSDRYYMRNKNIRPDEPFYLHSLNKKHSIGIYLYALGLVYQKKEMRNSAVETYRQALTFVPREPHLTQQLGHLYRELEKPWIAVEYYKESLAIDPNNGVTHSGLGDALLRSHELAQAMEHHRKAIALKPEDPVIRYNAGTAFFVTYQLEDAIREYQEAIRLDPKQHLAYYALAQVYVQKNEPAAAIAALQHSLQVNPSFSEAAALLRALRQKQEAEQENRTT